MALLVTNTPPVRAFLTCAGITSFDQPRVSKMSTTTVTQTENVLPRDPDQLLLWAAFTAFWFPIIGFILGIILVAKNRFAEGALTMVLSVVWPCILVMLSQ
jgi:hypothetical protein